MSSCPPALTLSSGLNPSCVGFLQLESGQSCQPLIKVNATCCCFLCKKILLLRLFWHGLCTIVLVHFRTTAIDCSSLAVSVPCGTEHKLEFTVLFRYGHELIVFVRTLILFGRTHVWIRGALLACEFFNFCCIP